MRVSDIVEAELAWLEGEVQRLQAGELDPELFKKIRLQFGVYSLRGESSRYMVRVRIPLGIVTPAQLDGLAEIVEAFTPQRQAHLTTRQDVQLYGIEQDRLVTLLRRLRAIGLTTREASGNVVRNVTLCPFAGIALEEPFDLTPYAQAMSDYLLRNPLTQILPRKVKIAFEGCPTDHARTPIHDIGIVAAWGPGRGQSPPEADQPLAGPSGTVPAEQGFRIYAGGGLGSLPRVGQLLEPWTQVELLLPTVEAILRVFDRFGKRQIRAKARLKFLVEELGWPEFKKRVLEERVVVWATQSGFALTACQIPLRQETPPPGPFQPLPVSDPQGLKRWQATNCVAQKQPGYVSVLVRVPLGNVTPGHLRGMAALARHFAGGIRLTNGQDLLLRFVPHETMPSVYEGLRELGLASPGAGRMADVTRCPGADTCLSAITHPRGLAEALERMFHNGLTPWADAPISIKISGCPNSCGHHHIADIGFYGVAVKVGERHLPCYQVLVGGRTEEGQAQFGQRLIKVPACRAPEAVKRIAQLYQAQGHSKESFNTFVQRVGLRPLEEALHDLADVSTASQQPELFVDLGATEPFELEAGKGECAE